MQGYLYLLFPEKQEQGSCAPVDALRLSLVEELQEKLAYTCTSAVCR